MQAVSTSPYNLSMARKFNTWYTIRDGNFSDPGVWMSNGSKKHSYPQPGDDVYVNNNIFLDTTNISINNLYISGSINANASVTVTITVNGDCQVSGSGLINLQLQFHNLILNGYNNIIPYSGLNAGSFSSITYNASNDGQAILNLPYRNLNTLGAQKYQVDDVTVDGTFNQQSNYDCWNYNLTVNGTAFIGTTGRCTFYKTGPGNLLFIGNADFEGNTDLTGGNPNIEFRGGLTIHAFSFETGNGNIVFTTNDQTINCSAFLSGSWSAPTTIQGAITVTLEGGYTFILGSTINGTVSGSTFNNSGILYLAYNAAPMTTGMFNYMFTSTSTIGYVFNGSYTLPYTTYANLIIDGTGLKLLGENTIINQSLLLLGNGVGGGLDTNGYDLTVSTTFTNQGIFSANAFSNILFMGLVTWTNGANGQGVDLRPGNPNIEFRGGLTCHANFIYTGTGTYTFSTNDQTFDMIVSITGDWACNILVSGAIALTYIGGAISTNLINGILNGNDAASIFINNGMFSYANSQQPMQTGKLYCNQTTNTFYYCAPGNQDITSPSDTTPGYQNLTLNGSGAKRLLGNVSVKGTYLLTPPATLDSNGFSLTNP
jgi:hypothetical protein